MRLFWAILLLFPLIHSCQVENPVSGKVYVFTPTVDLSLPEKFIDLQELAFINEKDFILSYSENYRHLLVKGTYSFTSSVIQLTFEKTAYESFEPPIKAISAVDTNEYKPVIMEFNCTLKEVSFELKDEHKQIIALFGDHPQVGLLDSEIDLETFKMGLEIQQLDFLLKKD